jgi:hypothetical protein
VTAGILLLTRARQLGLPLSVSVLGDRSEITAVPGPAMVHAPVLASCGVGRDLGTGGMVVVSGPPGEPLLVSLDPAGRDLWFYVDRSGRGTHPATEAYLRLAQDLRIPARRLAKQVRRSLSALGVAPDPAVLDILFGAPAPPLARLAIALRAGRSMSGGRGEPITRFLSGRADIHAEGPDPLPPGYERSYLEDLLRYGGLQWIIDGLSVSIRDEIDSFLEGARTLAAEDGGRDLALVYAVAEVASNLVQLPANSILPPLDAADDGVATTLGRALGANGDGDANRQLVNVFEFLGGRFVDSAQHVFAVDAAPAPVGKTDRWKWFCRQALVGYAKADELWPRIIDPPQ